MFLIGTRLLYSNAMRPGVDAMSLVAYALRGGSNQTVIEQEARAAAQSTHHETQSQEMRPENNSGPFIEQFLDEAPTRFVYRADRRPPNLIFSTGFTCRQSFRTHTHKREALEDYCAGLAVCDDDLSLVSTSRKKSVAQDFAYLNAIEGPVRTNPEVPPPKPQATVYKIATKGLACFDVNRLLQARSRYPLEEEIAFPDRIPPTHIIKAKDRVTRQIYRNPACEFEDDPCSSSDDEYVDTKPE
jgi:hypothetical protein